MRKNEFYKKFNKKDKMILKDYFESLNSHINLSRKETLLFNRDFENAINYYHSKNTSINEIINLLTVDNLGDCYNKNPQNWYPLDNAAKIYPLSMSEDWMSVFRVSYYLKEEVVPEILQIALTFTMKRFPTFRTSIRKGFFWNYIDEIKKRFHIYEDKMLPVSFINVSNIGKQSFKAVYYKNRISIEYFHILTDGYGGLVFLSTLINEYLCLLGKKVSFNDIVLDVKESPKKNEVEDEFVNRKRSRKSRSLVDTKALQIDGKLSNIKPCQIIHFDMPVSDIKLVTERYNCSMTELILAYLFLVISYSISEDGYIKIQVPVNMRNYYNSSTLRNFSLYIVVSIKKSNITNFNTVLKEIKKQMKEKNNIKVLEETMTYTSKLVSSLKYIPLIIKKPVAKKVYGYLGDKVLTTVLSNLGNVKITEDMKEYVEKMDLVLGTAITNRMLFSMVSCNGILTLSISKFTMNKSLENNLYNLIREQGINIKVHGSEEYENSK